ncbi:MAG: hypothetical protein OEY59_09305 [Deltaproteobacteria bacterium]|nr:hypothetical protein [Deltaproteobacteria bacterium]
MSKEVISINVDKDTRILVEVPKDHEDNKGVVEMERPDYLKRKRDFGEVVEIIRPIAEKLITPLREMSDQPDEIEVEFHFRFNSQSEMVLSSSDSESNIGVKLFWKGKKT